MQRHLISTSQIHSPFSVVIEKPTSNCKPVSKVSDGNILSGTPKENAHPSNRTAQTPLACPRNRTPISSSDTDFTEQSPARAIFLRYATSLMRVSSSRHLEATDFTSSKEAEIKAVSFLFNCSEGRATRLLPFILQTIKAGIQRQTESSSA